MKLKEKDLKNFKIIVGGGLKKYRFLSESFFLFFSLSLIGIGFGSFQIGNTSTSFNVSTDVGNVISGDIFSSTNAPETFTICKDGFVSNDIIYNEGQLIYHLGIDTKAAFNGGYIANNIINISTTLSTLNSQAIINSSYLTQVTVNSANGSSNLTDLSFNNNSLDNNFNFEINDLNSIFQFDLIYTFSGNFYNILTTNPIFNLNIKAVIGG